VTQKARRPAQGPAAQPREPRVAAIDPADRVAERETGREPPGAGHRGRPPGRSRAQDVDRHVGARVRERRVMLGLTQQQLAELIGTTYQQAHKYEKGVNRISAGRLHRAAQALGVGVGYFFEGAEAGPAPVPTGQQRLMLELARGFVALPRPQQEALCALARALAKGGDDNDGDDETGRKTAA
jgi:transcriptional regulator with XRE-family HTH domain